MGNCFEAVFKEFVQPNDDVYVDVVAPIERVHDRACELYLKLVEINNIKKCQFR
jgi:hypothetical protein